MDKITRIARVLTEDPDILQSDDPNVRNLGTTGYKGNVRTTGARYEAALGSQQADVKKLAKEVQDVIVNGAKMLANDPERLSKYLKLLKATVNTDLLKIAQYYRKQQQQQQ